MLKLLPFATLTALTLLSGCRSDPTEGNVSVSFARSEVSEEGVSGSPLFLTAFYRGEFSASSIQIVQTAGTQSLNVISDSDSCTFDVTNSTEANCTIEFDRPFVDRSERYQFRANAYDINGNFASNVVNVTFYPAVLEVDLGPDVQAQTGDQMSLSASLSYDSSAFTFAWTLVNNDSGSFDDLPQTSSSSSLAFSIPTGVDGSAVYQLSVTDAQGQEFSDFITLNINQFDPLIYDVDAGSPIYVTANETNVELQAQVTTSDNQTVYYYWESLTAGASVAATSQATTTAMVPAVAGDYLFKVYVSNSPIDATNKATVPSYHQDTAVVQYQ